MSRCILLLCFVLVCLTSLSVSLAQEVTKKEVASKAQTQASQPQLLALAPKDFEVMKSEPCTLFHIWATWCHLCIQELPGLVQMFEKNKHINPIIVDISSPFVQKNFSKKWVSTVLKPSFSTYLKPAKLKDSAYVKQIDPNWSGSLPFSVLYHNSKALESWTGSHDVPAMEKRIAALCKQ